jgi:hypothetical protein
MVLRFRFGFLVLALAAVAWTSPCSGQTSQPAPASGAERGAPPQAASSPPLPDERSSAAIRGTVVDQSGAVVAGARIRLAGPSPDPSRSQETLSGDDGQFFFAEVAAGAFELTIMADGFAPQTSSGTLRAGEIRAVPPIALAVAANITDVQVSLTRVEVAQEQVKDEEKQRVFGFIPNFYVTYDPHPLPLTARQKFELAWRTTVDPVTFAIVGGIAGVQQAENAFSGYGQGTEGYAKRYGSTYANLVTGTFVGSAILPSLLKQDPRYFYKGTGTTQSRVLYAVANSVVCKGDNGHWQVNYSNILGSLAAGGISNLYYPAQNRNGAALTFENTAIGIGATAAANLVEEFLMRKLTPNARRESAKP